MFISYRFTYEQYVLSYSTISQMCSVMTSDITDFISKRHLLCFAHWDVFSEKLILCILQVKWSRRLCCLSLNLFMMISKISNL